MTDVQVSNARRIIFTALAVVTFWVLAWRVYSESCNRVFHGRTFYDTLIEPFRFSLLLEWGVDPDPWIWPVILCVIGLLGLLPTAAVSLSRYNHLWKLRDRTVLVACLLFCSTTAFSFWFGFEDASPTYQSARSRIADRLLSWHGLNEHCWQTHAVSWIWLLLPIILTTAFVIFGAWRRAVRDRARGDVEEVVA